MIGGKRAVLPEHQRAVVYTHEVILPQVSQKVGNRRPAKTSSGVNGDGRNSPVSNYGWSRRCWILAGFSAATHQGK